MNFSTRCDDLMIDLLHAALFLLLLILSFFFFLLVRYLATMFCDIRRDMIGNDTLDMYLVCQRQLAMATCIQLPLRQLCTD